MVEITATSFLGKKYRKSYLDDELGYKIAEIMAKCEDCKTVDVIDGCTGELLMEYFK